MLQLLHAVVIVIVVWHQAGSKLAKSLIPASQLCIWQLQTLLAVLQSAYFNFCVN